MCELTFITFSSAVLLRKQRNASENWTPHGPLRKSAMHGHSSAFSALASRDWKIQSSAPFIYNLHWKEMVYIYLFIYYHLNGKINLRSIKTPPSWFTHTHTKKKKKKRSSSLNGLTSFSSLPYAAASVNTQQERVFKNSSILNFYNPTNEEEKI